MKLKKEIQLICSAGLCCLAVANSFGNDRRKPNVVFICVDDLRPNMGCYGDTRALTPHMDKLAQRGVVFSNAYCQQAVCNPSRASVMTGLRPDQIGVTNLESHFRHRFPDVETLPQAFMRNGYLSVGIGKIFHGQKNTQDDISWSKPPVMNLSQKKNEYVLERNREGGKADSYEWSDVGDEAYEDGRIAKEAIRELKELKKSESPFFLALGFKKPHLPFCAPKKYWDLYDEKNFAEVPNPQKPTEAPAIAFHDCQELRGYRDIGQGEIDAAKVSKLWQGYYACISYVDAQIGKIVNTIDELGLTENTIIVLWGDHGYHLGEQGLWCKSTNFELDTRTPLIISAPGVSKAGTHSRSIVEALDLYPTLVDLCGLKTSNKLSGLSLRPVLVNPKAEVKQAAFSQFVRPYAALRNQPPTHMGYSVRTKEWRCTAWFNAQSELIEFTELYRLDGSRIETENVAGDRRYSKTVEKLIRQLQEHRN